MSNIAKYKTLNIRESTPVIWFKCAYCGKYQCRRASKVKNPNLIFCDNDCRARYKQAQHYKHIPDKDIKYIRDKFKIPIRQVCVNISKTSGVPDILYDLEKEANMAIYKVLATHKVKDVEQGYMCSFIKRYLKAYLIKYEYSNPDVASFDFYDCDKVFALADTKVNIFKRIQGSMLFNKIKKNYANFPNSAKMALLREFSTKTDEEIMSLFGVNKRNLVNNIYQGKKYLEKRYREELN